MTNIKYAYHPPGTADFSLGVQRELAPSTRGGAVCRLNRLGPERRPPDQHPAPGQSRSSQSYNPYYDREGVANGSLPANQYRNYPGFSNINQEENESNFDYDSLQVGVRMENRHGLTTQVAYTWSHNISEFSNDLYGVSNPYN